MTYLAHSANGDGLPHSLRDHLQHTAQLAATFGKPFGADREAALAGMLHDFGKYAGRFQQRLQDPAIHGINHWAAGAIYAINHLKAPLVAYVVDGHHTGLPAATDFAQTRQRAAKPTHWHEHTGCLESISELLERFKKDSLKLLSLPSAPGKDRFANAFRARMLFSCLVDADFLDTEWHFDHAVATSRSVPVLQEALALRRLLDDVGTVLLHLILDRYLCEF